MSTLKYMLMDLDTFAYLLDHTGEGQVFDSLLEVEEYRLACDNPNDWVVMRMYM